MKIFIACLVLFSWMGISDASSAPVKTAKRSIKKGWHRAAEAVCGKLTGDNKIQCLAKEGKNRLEEGKDVVVDKATEIAN